VTKSFRFIPPKILLHNANQYGGGFYRILEPARTLRAGGYAVTQCTSMMLEDRHLQALAPDAVVFQHMHTEQQAENIRRYRKTLKNAALIYEIDDVFWEVPEASTHRKDVPFDIKQQMTRVMRSCDALTVTTAPLADLMSNAGAPRDIRILPNQLPKSFVNAVVNSGRTRGQEYTNAKLRVGWVGGLGHAGDLAIIADVMREIGDKVTWVFMGMVPPGIDQANVEFHPGVPFQQYAAALGALHLDIALAPLEHNTFNRCKSDLRVVEYGAAGCAVIASDIQPYELLPVSKVRNVPDTWVAAIRELVADPYRRFAEAENLHQYVVHHRVMEDHLLEFERAYLHRDTEAFLPISPAGAPSGRLVTIGATVGDLPAFPRVLDAWENFPGSDVLYVRPGASVSPVQAARLLDTLSHNASVFPLSNDGVFPRKNQFTAISDEVAAKLDEAAVLAAGEPVPQPYPTGPCILLSAGALARYGLPDESRFATFEGSLVDWAARSGEDGRKHMIATDTFVAVSQPSQLTQEYVQAVTEHTVAWTPNFLGTLAQSVSKDLLTEAREEIDLVYHRLNYASPEPDHTYRDWTRIYDEISQADCKAITADIDTWTDPPTINVIMPVYNPDPAFLAVAIESVMRQVYADWRLCIADDASTDPKIREVLRHYAALDGRIAVVYRETNGHICEASNTALEIAEDDSWVCFLDHDDVLPPHALYMIARESQLYPEAKFIYSDSDKLDPQGNRIDPYFAPDFNYELLLAQNYVCHLCAYWTDRVRALGGYRVGYEGSQDWDLTLRYLDRECGAPPDRSKIRHIPHVLYHWRMSPDSTAQNIMAKPYALDAGRRAVLDHIRRTGQNAAIASHPMLPIFNMVRFMVPQEPPLVSIIIPTKDSPEILARCVASIQKRTSYTNYEILIVDNDSRAKDARQLLTQLAKDPKISVSSDNRPFNFTRINNNAVKAAKGEFVCLMNDDTEVLEGAWLNDMVGAAMRDGVGAVGPKLSYPDSTVQQCGTLFDPTAPVMMAALHAFQRLPMNHPGQMGRAFLAAEWLAVTGACLLIKKTRYLEVGGLSDAFPYDYNDVDFCLRLHAKGYRNLVLGHVNIRHHEGYTKRQHATPETWNRVAADEDRLRLQWIDTIDPYSNPNLLHSPNLDSLRIPAPAKPWDQIERDRILIVNGTKDDAIAAYHRKQIAYCGTLDGHFFRLTYPVIANASALDLRDSPEAFVSLLGKLGIPRVLFCGIGAGTLGAVGFMTALAGLGWPVEFTPTGAARGENPNDYIDPDGWQRTWTNFLAAAARAPATGD
jgi:O-antigen biosynthesis protein